MNKGRVSRLESKRALTRPKRSTPALQRWWRGYLDRTLDANELVDLATAVVDWTDGVPLSDRAELRAEEVWGLVWGRAHGQDLANLEGMWGKQGSWSQLVEGTLPERKAWATT